MTPAQLTELKEDLSSLQARAERFHQLPLEQFAALIETSEKYFEFKAMAWRIFSEAFNCQDSISGETIDDYVIRQVAKLRSQISAHS